MVTFVFPLYFKNVICQGAPSGDALWGFSISLSMLLVAVISPVLGAAADYSGKRKRFLFVFTLISVVATALLSFSGPGMAIAAMVLFVLILSLISIFYGALLALMQINIRRLLAFSVVSHTGMLMIGIFCFNEFGLEGSLLLCIAYGLATAGMLFSVGLIYERTRTAFIPRLGGLFDTNATIAILFLVSALSTMVMPGTPGYDAAHLLLEGVIEEEGWLLAISILLGNVMAAAFLLRAFQHMFIATPKRFQQPYNSRHHPIREERIITLIICALLIITGFYTTPWLNFIDQEATDIGAHYPKHRSQKLELIPLAKDK